MAATVVGNRQSNPGVSQRETLYPRYDNEHLIC